MNLGTLAGRAPGWQEVTRVSSAMDWFICPYLGAPWDHRCNVLRSRCLSASVIIPSWNSGTSLLDCLRSLELSSLNRLAPGRLEVIVCDDGSTDHTWDLLQTCDLRLRITAVRLPHRSQSAALNIGLERASGEIVVFCDSDMVIGCGALDELLVRHEQWPHSVCFGFRSNSSAPVDRFWDFMHSEAFSRDNRVCFDVPTLLPNMLDASGWLQALSGDHTIIDSRGSSWRRHRFLFGCLFSARRQLVLDCAGFPDALHGWGYGDTLVAARLEAAGAFLLPVVSAWGHHLVHELRHPAQWFQRARNRLAYNRLLQAAPELDLWRRADSVQPIAIQELSANGRKCSNPDAHEPKAVAWNSRALLALGSWKRCLEESRREGSAEFVDECLFRLGRYEETGADARGSTLWTALSHHRLGNTGRAHELLAETADSDIQAAYAWECSPAELLALRDHHAAVGMMDTARIYDDVLEITGWRRRPSREGPTPAVDGASTWP